MSEYIKKEDALKALHDFWDECIGYDGSGTEMMLDNESVINNLPTYSFPDSAENAGEWIPASERLPEESGRYLTYIVNEYDKKLQYIMTADYISRPTPIEGLSPWNVDDECASDNVVAWQPLPKPYKGE